MKASFEKIYLNYLTLLILCTFLKCSYTRVRTVRNGLAFWNHDLATMILRFANTCAICDEMTKEIIWIITLEIYLRFTHYCLSNIWKRATDDCMIQSTRP